MMMLHGRLICSTLEIEAKSDVVGISIRSDNIRLNSNDGRFSTVRPVGNSKRSDPGYENKFRIK
jgi:hypothetical protein